MARAIDSEVAYQFLTEQLVKETGAFSKGVNKGLNIARSAMRNPDAIPTLASPAKDNNVPTKAPNEPLTCEGCVYLEEDTTPCAYCIRMKREVDYYCSPEGEEEI